MSAALREVATALRIARRELRGGFEGALVFLACLALGVAAIAAVGSVNRAVVEAIRNDARTLLGGDVELENAMVPIDEGLLAELVPAGARLAREVNANSTAAAGGRRVAVVLRAVDGGYPLVGALGLDPPIPLGEALADRGAAAEPALAARLGLEVGDAFRLGDATLTLRAILRDEPDRVGGFISIGPRVFLDLESLAASGIVQPGSIVDYEYRLALPEGLPVGDYAADLRVRYPQPSWRLRTSEDVEPGLAAVTDRLATFLTLAGLTALLVGGLGIGLAVQAYLAAKVPTIATLKCMGATGRQVVGAYLAQVLALAVAGVALGLVLGQLLTLALGRLPEALLPVRVAVGVEAGPLALAGAAGLLTALAFALWPLGIAREVPPAGLFRALVEPPRARPRWEFLLALVAAFLALAALAIAGVPRPEIGAWFVAVAAGSALALAFLARALLGAIRRLGERGPLALRLAARNLQRPNSGASSVTVALGAGLAVLTCVTLIQENLGREVAGRVPDRAPTTVFIDLQPDQLEPFRRLIAAEPGVRLREAAPHMRARITSLAGVPVEEATVAEEVRWTLSRDRGLTWRRVPPERAELAAGAWWPEGYTGPPLLSLGEEFAAGYGLGVGDTIGLNLLGRPMEAEVANLRRDLDFTSGDLTFFFIMSPGPIEAAPHTLVATVEASPEAEARLVAAVGDALPNVTAISIGAVVARLSEVLDRIGVAVRVVAGVTLATGLLVLAGAVGAARRRQRQQAVILKVIGARRRDVLRVLATEYAVLGSAAALVGAGLGTLGAWLLTREAMGLPWHFAPLPVMAVAAGAMALTLVVGAVATWRLLGVPAAEALRAP